MDAVIDELSKFISQVGFPIAVAIFVLWRMDAQLAQLTTAVDKITAAVEACTENGKRLGDLIGVIVKTK